MSIDGASPTVVDTVPADGTRHADAAIYTGAPLPVSIHTIVVSKLSGQYATFDGFEIDNPTP